MMFTATTPKRSIGIFRDRETTEKAIEALKGEGFDLSQVALIAQNVDTVKGTEQVQTKEGTEAEEGAEVGAVSGTVVGGIAGLLAIAGTISVPGIAPVAIWATSPILPSLGITAAGAGTGAVAGSLLGALSGLGIPDEKAEIYQEAIKGGSYLIVVNGSDKDLQKAKNILHNHDIEEYGIYNTPPEAR